MTTIVCIVGPSGCGKTAMAHIIEKELNIPMLVSYTTRPIRDNETNGIDHHFVTEDQMPPKEEMLAYTNFGGYHYWMPFSEIPTSGICTYVIDEKGLLMLKEIYSRQFNIISILIKRDIELLMQQVGEARVKRDLDRVTIPEEDYDYIITNNGCIDDFFTQSLNIFKQLL